MKRQQRADALAEWRTDVVDQRIADIYHHGTLNAEKRKREREENAKQALLEKRKRDQDAEERRKAEEAQARQRQLQADADEDAAILSAMRKAGVVTAAKKKVKKKAMSPQADVYNLYIWYRGEDENEEEEEEEDLEASWKKGVGDGEGEDDRLGRSRSKRKGPGLNLELARFPHAKVIKGEKLGPLGASHLATAIMPKRQLGSAHLSPGACPNLRELNLSFNQIRAKG